MEKVRSNFTLDSSEKTPPPALCVVWIPRPRPPKVPSSEYPRGTVRTAVTHGTYILNVDGQKKRKGRRLLLMTLAVGVVFLPSCVSLSTCI